MINVLWIDDEHQELSPTKAEAIDHDIKLHPYRSFEEGIKELECNFDSYDAILLDGKFVEHEDSSTDSAKREYSIQAKFKIDALPKKLDVYVLTGQAKLYEDETYNEVFGPKFIFSKYEEKLELFNKIKESAANQENYQIKMEHERVFKIIEKYSFPSKDSIRLTNILKALKTNSNFNHYDHFNALRKILESIFRKINEYGILHDDCIKDGEINLSESSKFLAGKQCHIAGVKSKITIVPRTIAFIIQNLVNITGAGSHTSADDGIIKANIDRHLKDVGNSPYLLYSITFGLMDSLLWLDSYISNHSDKDENKRNWETLSTNTITGYISQDEEGNYHCEKYALNKKYIHENDYYEGDEIEITSWQDNTNYRTKKKYPKFATHFRRVQ